MKRQAPSQKITIDMNSTYIHFTANNRIALRMLLHIVLDTIQSMSIREDFYRI